MTARFHGCLLSTGNVVRVVTASDAEESALVASAVPALSSQTGGRLACSPAANGNGQPEPE